MLLEKNIGIVVFMTVLCHTGLCQVYPDDSASVSSRMHAIYKSYIDTIGGASLLFNGPAYVSVYQGILGNPFFETNKFMNGSVCYNGVRYYNIALRYDLVTDELIIKGFRNENISLVREKVDSFSVMNHLFVRVLSDSIDFNAPEKRFFDLRYDGKKTKFVATRRKAIIRALHAEDPSSFILYNTYYVIRENVFYPVANKKTLIRLLEGSDAMKKYWKKNAIDFNKDAEQSIGKAVEYYDQLKRNYE